MVAIHWVAVEPATGAIIEELPGAQASSPLVTMMCRSGGNVTLSLPVKDRLPARWELATEPNRTVIVAHYDDPDRTVLWAGVVVRQVVGSGPTIDVTMVDALGWLDQTTRVPTKGFGITDDGQTVIGPVDLTEITKGLILDVLAANFNGTAQTFPVGQAIAKHYKAEDNLSRLSAAQDLLRARNPPEFAIYWSWDVNGNLVSTPTAGKLGRRVLPGQEPFTFTNLEWERTRDYGPGKGATIVVGGAKPVGDLRPTVTAQADELLAAGYLPAEYRFETQNGVQADMEAEVSAKLTEIKLGTTTYAFTAPLAESGLILGRDVGLGDDVQVDMINPDLPGSQGTFKGRLVGWAANPVGGDITAVNPIFFKDEV